MQSTSSGGLIALIAYLFAPLGSLLALLSAGDDATLKRHGQQSLIAGSVGVVLTIVLGFIPQLGCVAMPFAGLFWLYMLWCGVQAYQGKDVTIPVISGIEF